MYNFFLHPTIVRIFLNTFDSSNLAWKLLSSTFFQEKKLVKVYLDWLDNFNTLKFIKGDESRKLSEAKNCYQNLTLKVSFHDCCLNAILERTNIVITQFQSEEMDFL